MEQEKQLEPEQRRNIMATGIAFSMLVFIMLLVTFLVNTGFYDSVKTIAGGIP